MRVHVDAEKCQGHNRCYAIAPELFDVDDLGQAHELNDGNVPPDLEDKARMAVANCPEYAIETTERVDDQTPAGEGLRHRLRSHRPAVGHRPVPDLGRAARQVP